MRKKRVNDRNAVRKATVKKEKKTKVKIKLELHKLAYFKNFIEKEKARKRI